MSEALASPTLALLYLAQGHPRRARATLAEVLEAEPENGYALALLERLREPPEPKLDLGFREELEVPDRQLSEHG